MASSSAAAVIETPTASVAPPDGSKVSAEILRIANAVKTTAQQTEGSFLEVGERLTSSVEILERLTTLFDTLQHELDSPEMQSATEGLARVAQQVSVLSGMQRDERTVLQQLSKIAVSLRRRIDEIYREVRTIGVLTINAKISASSVGAAGADFLTYIVEIGQSLKVAETNLGHFRSALAQVSAHLEAASASEAEFGSRHAETIAIIPDQLAQSLDLITERRQAAAEAAGRVSVQSQAVSAGIGRVIMALQVGDATRQRMEHAQEAAEFLTEILGAAGPAAADEPWAYVSGEERLSLAGAGCALQAAQLADTADELKSEIKAVHKTLAQLSKDAREIVSLGTRIFGVSDPRGDHGFLDELERNVDATGNLFGGFHEASLSADRTIGSVLDLVTRLSEHIASVRAVEADIRIMGVNSTLKSHRLGTVGAALGVVAEEITKSSAHTASEAKAATADVDEIVVAARSLGGKEQASRVTEITAVTELMTSSTERLRGVAASLTDALDALARDGRTVTDLIDDTAASLKLTVQIDASLRRSAEAFDAVASSMPRGPMADAEARDQMFRQMAKRYTMAREREIHARFAPDTLPVAAVSTPAAETTVDDLLF